MNAGAVANDGNIEIRDIPWCVPSIDPCNNNRIIVQTVSTKNIDFSYYEGKTFYKMFLMLLTSFLTLTWRVVWNMERPQCKIVGFENNVNEPTQDGSLFELINVTVRFRVSFISKME